MSVPPSSHSFRAIYREQFPYVWGVLRRVGTPPEDIEDLAQEVFLVAHRRLDAFQGRSSVRTWLYGIALRVFWNDRRRRAKRPQPTEHADRQPDASEDDPEDYVARRQANKLLYKLLDKLDHDKRTVFVLAELEGMTIPAIARITRAPTRTVYSRLRAARHRFSDALGHVRARERNMMRARELIRTGARGDRPQPQVAGRVWAAMAVHLGWPARGAAIATTVLGGVGLKGVAVIAATLGLVGMVIVSGRDAGGSGVMGRGPSVYADEEGQREQNWLLVAEPDAERSPEPPSALTRPASLAPTLTNVVGTPRQEVRPHRPKRSQPMKTSSPSLLDELQLMNDIRQALRTSQSERALALLETHERRFPASSLVRERRRSRITALCQAQLRDEASNLARVYGLPGC